MLQGGVPLVAFLDFLKKSHAQVPAPDVDLAAVEQKIRGVGPESTFSPDAPATPPPVPDDEIPLPPSNMIDPEFKPEPSEGASPVSPAPVEESPSPPAQESKPTAEATGTVGTTEAVDAGEQVRDAEPAQEARGEPAREESRGEQVPQWPAEPVAPDQGEEPAGQARADEPVQEEHLAELPDFSEEDLAALESVPEYRPVGHPVEEPPAEERPVAEQATDELPAGGQDEKVEAPLPPSPQGTFENLDEGMFLSSDDHFALLDDISSLRKSLRHADESIAKVTSGHDQMDVQLRRIAESMNTIQERLIEIDGALFEE